MTCRLHNHSWPINGVATAAGPMNHNSRTCDALSRPNCPLTANYRPTQNAHGPNPVHLLRGVHHTTVDPALEFSSTRQQFQNAVSFPQKGYNHIIIYGRRKLLTAGQKETVHALLRVHINRSFRLGEMGRSGHVLGGIGPNHAATY